MIPNPTSVSMLSGPSGTGEEGAVPSKSWLLLTLGICSPLLQAEGCLMAEWRPAGSAVLALATGSWTGTATSLPQGSAPFPKEPS